MPTRSRQTENEEHLKAALEGDHCDDHQIRVLVVDGHQLVAESVAKLIDTVGGMAVVGVATTDGQAAELLSRMSVDVLVIDHRLGEADGIACAAELKSQHPRLRALILGCLTDGDVVSQAVREGCDGFLRKTSDGDNLVAAIRTIHSGETAFGIEDLTRAMQSMRDHDWIGKLSARELDVLKLMATGAGTDAMAEVLHITNNTVRSHVRHILEKLSAHSKLQAVSIALRQGIIEPPPRLVDRHSA